MVESANLKRRADLKRALKRLKPDDMFTLEDVARLWGVTKPRFVSVRNTMAGFPDPLPGQGNLFIYPAAKAVRAMLDHETRHDEAAKARAARTNAILGRTARGRDTTDAGRHTPNELATLARLAAETEQRERDQGLYVPVTEMAAVAGDVFSEMSEFMAGLSNKVDPHGMLPPDVRGKIDSGAAEALLQLHRRMKEMLSPDAKPRPNRAKARRTRAA